MIVGIEGDVVKKEPTALYLKTASGLTYLLRISLQTSAAIEASRVSLHTTFVVKEESQTLFGFATFKEKSLFDRLIKINGVGPGIALAICSTFTPESFAKAVAASDVAALKSVPGIGPKSAKRILVELGDFRMDLGEESPQQRNFQEALLALESLGFKKEKVEPILSQISASSTAEMVKETLKQLVR